MSRNQERVVDIKSLHLAWKIYISVFGQNEIGFDLDKWYDLENLRRALNT